MENQLRRWKRERVSGLDTAEASAKVSYWNNQMKNFLEQTGLKRQSTREKVIVFDKEHSAKARGEAGWNIKQINCII